MIVKRLFNIFRINQLKNKKKKLFFNHCFIISFTIFIAMILLQILKSIKKILVLIIILLSVRKEVMSIKIDNFISNNVKSICSSEKMLIIFEYQKNNICHNGSSPRNTLINSRWKKVERWFQRSFVFLLIVVQSPVE